MCVRLLRSYIRIFICSASSCICVCVCACNHLLNVTSPRYSSPARCCCSTLTCNKHNRKFSEQFHLHYNNSSNKSNPSGNGNNKTFASPVLTGTCGTTPSGHWTDTHTHTHPPICISTPTYVTLSLTFYMVSVAKNMAAKVFGTQRQLQHTHSALFMYNTLKDICFVNICVHVNISLPQLGCFIYLFFYCIHPVLYFLSQQ